MPLCPKPDVQWIKTPLDDSVDWPDVPPGLPGRVILKRWPAAERAGRVILPSIAQRKVYGVAWVYRATGEAQNALHPGDTVILPEHTLSAGTLFPSDDIMSEGCLEGFHEVAAEDVLHFLPYADALGRHEKACHDARKDFQAGFDAIRKAFEAGDLLSAARDSNGLKARSDFLTDAQCKKLEALDKKIVAALVDADAKRRAAADPKEGRKQIIKPGD